MAENLEGIESACKTLMILLSRHFETHPFLLGGYPTLADYALMAPVCGYLDRADEVAQRALRMQAALRATADVGEQQTRTLQSYDFEGTLKRMRTAMPYPYRLESPLGRYVCLISGDAGTLDPLLGQKVRVWGEKHYRADWNMYVCDVKRVEAAPSE